MGKQYFVGKVIGVLSDEANLRAEVLGYRLRSRVSKKAPLPGRERGWGEGDGLSNRVQNRVALSLHRAWAGAVASVSGSSTAERSNSHPVLSPATVRTASRRVNEKRFVSGKPKSRNHVARRLSD